MIESEGNASELRSKQGITGYGNCMLRAALCFK